ncbi:hypothetical protein F4780DRAFT_410403 [Xylariomycetidae sp. FL0641]|nr:hypothetical protein F4780DRAFT_410403 [Xylariomycetidae sp. FL0641]
MAEDGDAASRLRAELELLEAMYPDAITFSDHTREVKYTHSPGSGPSASLVLRLPEDYPASGSPPDIISATGPGKADLRSAMKEAVAATAALSSGEEMLDAVIASFQDLLVAPKPGGVDERDDTGRAIQPPTAVQDTTPHSYRTVVVWLHHLLNTNKRKLALNPSFQPSDIAGITKPGYPGVLVFSGGRDAVDAHVAELRSQKWQAFQVRYDEVVSEGGDSEARLWRFTHQGIREVESMSDVAQAILDPTHREEFLTSIGVK